MTLVAATILLTRVIFIRSLSLEYYHDPAETLSLDEYFWLFFSECFFWSTHLHTFIPLSPARCPLASIYPLHGPICQCVREQYCFNCVCEDSRNNSYHCTRTKSMTENSIYCVMEDDEVKVLSKLYTSFWAVFVCLTLIRHKDTTVSYTDTPDRRSDMPALRQAIFTVDSLSTFLIGYWLIGYKTMSQLK